MGNCLMFGIIDASVVLLQQMTRRWIFSDLTEAKRAEQVDHVVANPLPYATLALPGV